MDHGEINVSFRQELLSYKFLLMVSSLFFKSDELFRTENIERLRKK